MHILTQYGYIAAVRSNLPGNIRETSGKHVVVVAVTAVAVMFNVNVNTHVNVNVNFNANVNVNATPGNTSLGTQACPWAPFSRLLPPAQRSMGACRRPKIGWWP